MNFKSLKNIWTIIIILIVVFSFYTINSNGEKKYKSLYENEINGIVDSIYYGVKSEIIVQIKSKEYNLLIFNIRKGIDINKSDSLYKSENSKKLELHSKSLDGSYIYTENFKMRE